MEFSVLNLVIFDVDGTLTHSSKADMACFAYMVRQELGIANMNTNLAEYEHATSSFIYRHLFEQQHHRKPQPEEVAKAQATLTKLLRYAVKQKPQCIRAIGGAAALFKRLRNHPDWQVAIATGGWKSSALFKLEYAGVDVNWVPAAFADDALSREGIIGRARENAQATAQVVSFDRIVCVGDGLWDIRAAQSLGYGFIGITGEAGPGLLARNGARVLLPDYSNADAFMHALESADSLLAV